MACNKGFSSSYMLLKSEEVTFTDLIRLSFYSDIDKRKFVDYPEDTDQEPFTRKWIILISILVQKILMLVSKPLAWFGSEVEQWLNLLSSNGNLVGLLFNFLRGKMVVPDRTSATFLSFIGNLDKRVELDKNIKFGDSRYYAVLSMMAAKASYENKAFLETTVRDHWKMKLIGAYDFWNAYQERATTQAFILQNKTDDPELIVVGFRGTEPFDSYAWCSDFDLSWYELHQMGRIHGGFMKALGLQKNEGWPKEIIERAENEPKVAYYAIREKLREILRVNDKAKVIITGHSLGGALAILFPAILAWHEEEWLLERLDGVYTFGQPRVGDEKFVEYMKEKMNKYSIPYYRFVYSNDLVPRLPYDDTTLMFKHFGACLYYNSFYKGQIVEEEPNKNYFSILWVIPKILNAVYELIRSFFIPYTKGKEYKEGGLLLLFRLIGMLIPGVPNHCPQDYVNSTRLGESDLFLEFDGPKIKRI